MMSAWCVPRSLAIAMAAAFWLAPAHAQQYPAQDIRLICGYPAGSGADVIVRYYAEKLKAITGRTVLVENKVGALGNIATEHTARAKPDGYTIYLNGGGVIAANMYLFKKPPVDIVKELQVAAGINRLSSMLTVRSDRPWKTLAELTAYLKERGEKASYASSNPVSQAVGEIYKQKAGLSAVQVSYKTGFDSANDMQSGQVDFAVLDPIYALAQRREGRLRVLAIASAQRMEAVSDIPTFTEQGIPMDLLGWWGAFVPAATPRAIVERLSTACARVLARPDVVAALRAQVLDPSPMTPEEFGAFMRAEREKWGRLIRSTDVKLEG